MLSLHSCKKSPRIDFPVPFSPVKRLSLANDHLSSFSIERMLFKRSFILHSALSRETTVAIFLHQLSVMHKRLGSFGQPFRLAFDFAHRIWIAVGSDDTAFGPCEYNNVFQLLAIIRVVEQFQIRLGQVMKYITLLVNLLTVFEDF